MTTNTLDTLAVATGLLGEPLEPVGHPLPTSARNRVVRARRPDGSTVVVKRYLDSTHDGRWRELCALKALHWADAAVPAVIAANDDLVVMEDLGDRPHLAAAMLSHDPADAARGLLEWARALGHLHAAGFAAAATFEGEFRSRTGRPSDYMTDELADAAATWPQLGRRLEVSVEAPFEVLAQVPGRFRTRLETISPGDVCPDNNLRCDSGVTLIDLEFAGVRHAAWDLSYLTVPWPSCWCAWAMPEDAADAAVSAWADAVGVERDADLEHDLALAADAWHWLSANWLLDRLIGDQYAQRPDRPSPRAQDRIARSLDRVAHSELLPEIAGAATTLLAGLAARYDVEPLPVMPAFR
ncbi:hypothetical protein IEE94_05180 [Yimella sp. cx-573]|nr:hypothetical protein [Yimella sp. cx-573]